MAKAKQSAKSKKKPAKKSTKEPASKKYANGTTYKDSDGKTHKRISKPGTPAGNAYCGRSAGQKQTEKVKVRRKAWKCKGKKSMK